MSKMFNDSKELGSVTIGVPTKENKYGQFWISPNFCYGGYDKKEVLITEEDHRIDYLQALIMVEKLKVNKLKSEIESIKCKWWYKLFKNL